MRPETIPITLDEGLEIDRLDNLGGSQRSCVCCGCRGSIATAVSHSDDRGANCLTGVAIVGVAKPPNRRLRRSDQWHH